MDPEPLGINFRYRGLASVKWRIYHCAVIQTNSLYYWLVSAKARNVRNINASAGPGQKEMGKLNPSATVQYFQVLIQTILKKLLFLHYFFTPINFFWYCNTLYQSTHKQYVCVVIWMLLRKTSWSSQKKQMRHADLTSQSLFSSLKSILTSYQYKLTTMSLLVLICLPLNLPHSKP